MDANTKTLITIRATIEAPVEKVWNYWTDPEHITCWNFASPEWHSPWAKNDLRPNGMFSSRMEARDGSMGFDFFGTHEEVILYEKIKSILGDDRHVTVLFRSEGNRTELEESFEAENTNSIELQRLGWQSILNNFKNYTETH